MPDAKQLSNRIWGVVGILFALVIFGFLVYTSYISALLVMRGKTTDARCTKIETKTSGSGSNRSTTTTWTVRYEIEDGTTLTGTIDASFSGIREGDTIEVLYDPLEPSRVEANRFISLWMYPLIGFGVLALVSYGFIRKRLRGSGRRAARDKPPRRQPPETSSSTTGQGTATWWPTTPFRWGVVGVFLLLAGLASWGFDFYRAGHRYAVQAAAYHPDGSQLVTVGSDPNHCELIVWDVPHLAKQRTISLERGRVSSVAVSKHGQAIVRCEPAGTEYDEYPPRHVDIVDLGLGRVTATFREPNLARGTLLHDDANQLVIYSSGSIELRSLADESTRGLELGNAASINCASLSLNQHYLAAGADQAAVLWSFAEQGAPLELPAPGIDVGVIAVSDDGRHVAAAPASYARLDAFPLLIWNTESNGEAVTVASFEHPVQRLEFLPGEPPRLLAIHGTDHLAGHIDIYGADGSLSEAIYDEKYAIVASDLTADGSRLLVCNSRGEGRAWDLSGERAQPLWSRTVGELSYVYLDPRAETFTGHAYTDPKVSLFSTSSGERLTSRAGYRVSPVTRWLLMAIPFVILMAVVLGVQSYMAKRREDVFTTLARHLGWRKTAGDLPASLPAFQFTQRRSGGHFEHALIGGKPTDPLLAIYRWTEASGESGRRVVREVVAIYPFALPDTPNLLIRPESLGDKLAAYVGFEDIDLEGSASQQQFSAKYLLRSDDKERMPHVIHDALAQLLCENEGWNVEVKQGSALVWWQRTQSFTTGRFNLQSVAGMRAFLEESQELIGRFASDNC